MPIGYADTEGSIKCRLKTKYADWAKNADWNKICRLERNMLIGQTIQIGTKYTDAAVLDVRVLDYHRRTHARSQCVCVCMCMYVCTCVISNDVRACVFACICMRAYACMHAYMCHCCVIVMCVRTRIYTHMCVSISDALTKFQTRLR